MAAFSSSTRVCGVGGLNGVVLHGGLLALIYNGINSSIDAYRGKHDIYNAMAAGGVTGALFKSTGENSSDFLVC